MKQITGSAILLCLIIFSGCKNSTDVKSGAEVGSGTVECKYKIPESGITARNFKMGFSTWTHGPDKSDKNETYRFIANKADIYSEQIDDKIPWDSLINKTGLPARFVEDIEARLSRRLPDHQLLLSVSLLNSDRSDLLEDYDGTVPDYTAINDPHIEDAYFRLLDYLITGFDPDYLVIAMEINDLKLKSEKKWRQYKSLAAGIRARIKAVYPDISISESVTLHNYFNPETANKKAFIEETSHYINQNHDFAAISFYPFFKGLHSKSDFQLAFDFLHAHINKPIAFVETTHLAETLEIESLDLTIPGSHCEQQDYLEVLLSNAIQNNYKFIIWWAYRDFDELWKTFPDQYKDLGKLWRDTGLLDEDGNRRPVYKVWEMFL